MVKVLATFHNATRTEHYEGRNFSVTYSGLPVVCVAHAFYVAMSNPSSS